MDAEKNKKKIHWRREPINSVVRYRVGGEPSENMARPILSSNSFSS